MGTETTTPATVNVKNTFLKPLDFDFAVVNTTGKDGGAIEELLNSVDIAANEHASLIEQHINERTETCGVHANVVKDSKSPTVALLTKYASLKDIYGIVWRMMLEIELKLRNHGDNLSESELHAYYYTEYMRTFIGLGLFEDVKVRFNEGSKYKINQAYPVSVMMLVGDAEFIVAEHKDLVPEDVVVIEEVRRTMPTSRGLKVSYPEIGLLTMNVKVEYGRVYCGDELLRLLGTGVHEAVHLADDIVDRYELPDDGCHSRVYQHYLLGMLGNVWSIFGEAVDEYLSFAARLKMI